MKALPTFFKVSCAAALFCSVIVAARAQNIVVDPGFENSPGGGGPTAFSPAWTSNDTTQPNPPGTFVTGVGTDSAFAHSGNNYAFLGYEGSTADPFRSLTQTLSSTVLGQAYTFSFWLGNDGNPPGNFFQALFNNSSVMTLTDSPTFGYQLFQFTVFGTGGPTPLEFRFRNDDFTWDLDDVSVSVPENGSTAWLALPTILGLFLLRARLSQRQKNALS